MVPLSSALVALMLLAALVVAVGATASDVEAAAVNIRKARARGRERYIVCPLAPEAILGCPAAEFLQDGGRAGLARRHGARKAAGSAVGHRQIAMDGNGCAPSRRDGFSASCDSSA